jgi:hypothetical protein
MIENIEVIEPSVESFLFRKNSNTNTNNDHGYNSTTINGALENESAKVGNNNTPDQVNNNVYLEPSGESSTDDVADVKDAVANEETEEAGEESDQHLERVQTELDRLNYSNEAINNLELELEESKREYVRLMQSSEEQLTVLEKKLGSCVAKARPYYEARIDLNDSKHKYLVAKHRFETAQELYVAAKNMQMYAEENLENFVFTVSQPIGQPIVGSSLDRESLLKILEIAKVKVNDTELSKQSSDAEQIEAFKVYDGKRVRVEQMERELKKFIDKSRRYFELKSSLYKELRFLFTKIEGLRSCVKEAKLCYQQSLRNLETISTEIHTQRKSLFIGSNSEVNNENDASTQPPGADQGLDDEHRLTAGKFFF